jgi:hypothetical protein
MGGLFMKFSVPIGGLFTSKYGEIIPLNQLTLISRDSGIISIKCDYTGKIGLEINIVTLKTNKCHYGAPVARV